MPVYEITCPHCEEMFELQVGLDMDATVKLIYQKVKECDARERERSPDHPKYRTYKELQDICGDKAISVGRLEFNRCVGFAVERGFLERSKIGRRWKFRWKKRYEYPARPSQKTKRRTGTTW